MSEKEKLLEQAMTDINKRFGTNSILKLGNSTSIVKVEAISTGSIKLDTVLGVGGIPKGRITEIFGPESSGKTTLALHVIAECQKNGGIAAFIDAEHAIDPEYSKSIGVDIDNLIISQPDCGEQALEIAETLVRSSAVDIIVVDSVAALVPRAELQGDMGDSHVGLQARLMSQAMRKLTGAVSKSKCSIIFINQLREKVGIMFGNPETTPGGRALKFYSSVRIDVRKVASVKNGDEVIGNSVKVKTVKNKVAPPFREAEIVIKFGKGIDIYEEIVDVGVEKRIIEKSGAWFTYNGERRQGKSAMVDFIKSDNKIFEEILEKIKNNDQITEKGAKKEEKVS